MRGRKRSGAARWLVRVMLGMATRAFSLLLEASLVAWTRYATNYCPRGHRKERLRFGVLGISASPRPCRPSKKRAPSTFQILSHYHYHKYEFHHIYLLRLVCIIPLFWLWLCQERAKCPVSSNTPSCNFETENPFKISNQNMNILNRISNNIHFKFQVWPWPCQGRAKYPVTSHCTKFKCIFFLHLKIFFPPTPA